MNSNIEDLIRTYVNFRHGVANGGWNVTYCEYCGDGSRKKGPRGGWMFSDGGASAFYHCFNCGANESFSTNREYAYSKNVRDVLDSFGIPKSDYEMVVFNSLDTAKKVVKKTAVVPYTFLDMPDHFKLLKDCDDEGAKSAKKFIKDEYGLSTSSYSFYYGSGNTIYKDKKNDAKAFFNRLIIPYYKSGKLIYYQGRDITNKSKLKYLSPNIPKNNILFNVDELYLNTTKPLYVVEGAPDAIHVGGVATLGNELTSQQLELLKQSKRKKVLIPDFGGDSAKLCEQFVKNDWSIAFPQYRTSCKDISAAVVKYGKLYTVHGIVTNITDSDTAELLMGFMNVS